MIENIVYKNILIIRSSGKEDICSVAYYYIVTKEQKGLMKVC